MSPGIPTLLLLLSLFLAACPATGPYKALSRYLAAIEAGRFTKAYKMTSASFRAASSLDEFKGALTGAALQAAARSRRGLNKNELPAKTRIDLGGGRTVTLVREKKCWRVADGLPLSFSQRTPLEAIRSFLRALKARRFDILLRFVPRRYRRKMTMNTLLKAWRRDPAEMKLIIKELGASLNNPLKKHAFDHVSMCYGKWIIDLILEEGRWKVLDPN